MNRKFIFFLMLFLFLFQSKAKQNKQTNEMIFKKTTKTNSVFKKSLKKLIKKVGKEGGRGECIYNRKTEIQLIFFFLLYEFWLKIWVLQQQHCKKNNCKKNLFMYVCISHTHTAVNACGCTYVESVKGIVTCKWC